MMNDICGINFNRYSAAWFEGDRNRGLKPTATFKQPLRGKKGR